MSSKLYEEVRGWVKVSGDVIPRHCWCGVWDGGKLWLLRKEKYRLGIEPGDVEKWIGVGRGEVYELVLEWREMV